MHQYLHKLKPIKIFLYKEENSLKNLFIMDVINLLFGEGEHLNPLQMACRILVIYLVALLWIRVAGRRAFGRLSTFDNVISILLGAVLSRAVVGLHLSLNNCCGPGACDATPLCSVALCC